MNKTEVVDLLVSLWQQACNDLPELNALSPTFEFGESNHFLAPRGFAALVYDGSRFHLKLSTKLVGQDQHRVDAILRHEIGHIIDFAQIELPPGLPTTPERRADAIAEFIWKDTIFYDDEMVQSLSFGIFPRPEALGL